MALYAASLEVPAKTPSNAPAETVIKPGVGLVKRVRVSWKKGALHSVSVKIMDEGRQFAPLPSGWLSGDNETVEWSENRRLQGPPYRIIIQGYSVALDWAHTVTVEMEII